MEEHEQDIIRKLGPRLLKLTSCTVHFLAYFTSSGMLNSADIEQIEARGRQEGSSAKTSKFYELIQTRSGSFDHLLKALEETGQTGARDLLKNTLRPSVSSKHKQEKIVKFSKPPQYLDGYLKDATLSLILVLSFDPKFTCDRIYEPLRMLLDCKTFEYPEFLKYVSEPSSLDCRQSVLHLVNCEDKNYLTLLHSGACEKMKVILVASKLFKNFPGTLLICHEKVLWKELTPVFQDQIYQRVQAMTTIPDEMCLDFLFNLDSDIFAQIVQEKPVKFLKDTIPPKLTYYIPRFLVTRDVISNKIFEINTTDIVLIEKIERHQLTELVNSAETAWNVTDTSSNLIETFPTEPSTCKFVLLEHPSHFKVIACRLKKFNVHYLEYINEKLRWRRSHGDVQLVQACIEKSQIEINEDVFIQCVNKQANRTVCISDTPGMGKSVLLAHIASNLKEMDESKNVVFVVINELVQQVKLNLNSDITLTQNYVVEALATIVCENELGRQAMKFKPSLIQHLFLDAFDEISSNDVTLGYDCLNLLQAAFPKTFIWISTRPHLLIKMEQKLNILGYNIKGFDEADQLVFLSRFWMEHTNVEIDREKLNVFGKICIKNLKANLNHKQEDFAGIPLQCLLIAEVYEEHAKEYAEPQSTHNINLDTFRITSLLDLYEKLVHKKLTIFAARYQSVHSLKLIERAHVYHALLFPEHITCLEHQENGSDFVTEDLTVVFNTGIMEPKPTKYEPKPRFVHRTFAEFFIAKFLVDSLKTKGKLSVMNLLFQYVLQTVTTCFKVSTLKITARNFKYNVICYFLESMLQKGDAIECNFAIHQIKNLNLISVACSYSNSENIFRKLVLPFYEENPIEAEKVFQTNFVVISVARAGRGILSTACAMLKTLDSVTKIHEIRIKDQTLLELAVSRGNYTIMEYLINTEGFGQTINSEVCINLVYKCVNNSMQESETVIQEKKQTLAYLVQKISPDMSNIVLHLNCSFVKNCKNVHYLLIYGMHQLGLLGWETATEYLNSNARCYSCNQILYITNFLTKQNKLIKNNFWNHVINKTTLIYQTFSYVEVNDELLDYFEQHNVTLKNLEQKDQRVLFQAVVRRNKNKRVIKYVLHDFDVMNSFNTHLSWCWRYHHWTAVLILLEEAKRLEIITAEIFSDIYGKLNMLKNLKGVENIILFCINNDVDIIKQNTHLIDVLLRIQPFPKKICLLLLKKHNRNEHELSYVNNIITYMFLHFPLKSIEKFFFLISQFKNQPLKNVRFKCLACEKNLVELAYEYICSKVVECTEIQTSCYSFNQVPPRFLEDILHQEDLSAEKRLKYVENILAYFENCQTTLQFCCENIIQEKLALRLSCVFVISETAIQKIIQLSNGERIEILKTIIKYGADVNTNSGLGTPLYQTTKHYPFPKDCWDLILQNGGNPFHSNENLFSPIAELLINHEVMVSSVLSGVTPYIHLYGSEIPNFICTAIANCKFTIVLQVCGWYGLHHPDSPIRCMTGFYEGIYITPLDAALLSDDGDILDFIYKKGCITALAPFKQANKVLTFGFENALINSSKYLETLGKIFQVTPQIRKLIDSHSPLLYPGLLLDIKIALVDLGCSVNVKDAEENTPLHYALDPRYWSTCDPTYVKKLIDNGANVNAKNSLHQTPFQIVVLRCLDNILYLSKSDVNRLNCIKHGLNILCILLENNADIIENNEFESFLQEIVVNSDFLGIALPFLHMLRKVLSQKGITVLHSNKETNQQLLDLCTKPV